MTSDERVATDSAFQSVGFYLDAKPPVNCGCIDGARHVAERRTALQRTPTDLPAPVHRQLLSFGWFLAIQLSTSCWYSVNFARVGPGAAFQALAGQKFWQIHGNLR